jgi:DHA3 family macrolide efflux protein-like MFS transporter
MENTTTASPSRDASNGVKTFVVIWFGQLVSLVGSGLTSFALGVWLYQQTGSVTLFALNALFFTLPQMVFSPFAGALVDRWDRRWAMIISDAGAGLTTLLLAALLLFGRLEYWHIYVATFFNALFGAFQWPAYSAATTLLVPKKHLGRAGGMVQLGEAISQLVAPAFAGVLLVTIGLRGIILIDFGTFAFAVITLLVVRIPRPEVSAQGAASKGSLWKEAAFGWRYIVVRPGLLGLLVFFSASNFLWGMVNPLLFPTVLSMTTPDVLGYLASIVGLGMLAGTLVMSAWGGPRRRVNGILGFEMIQGLLAIVMGLRPSVALLAGAGVGILFCSPIVNGSSQALWQSKVHPDLQGRVFAVRRMIAMAASPLAYIVVGPLADKVFEPLMAVDGPLAPSVGRIIGTGPGRGNALMFIVIGFLSIVVGTAAYLYPRIRLVEDELPDAIPDRAPLSSDQSEKAKTDLEPVPASAG